MTFEETLVIIEGAGFKICNLFQLETGIWQCNLWDGELHWEFATGKTPAESVQIALLRTNEKGIPAYETKSSIASKNALDNFISAVKGR